MRRHTSFSQTQKMALATFFVIAAIALTAYSYRCVTEKVCGSVVIDKLVRSSVEITLPAGIVHAEVVDTQAARELGLSERRGLSEGTGMLFVFEKEGRYGFWMKDMQFPIDIIWISSSGLVVQIVEHARPEDYPDTTYINTIAAAYVLELREGDVAQYGVKVGSRITIGE
ncbi:MAG: DUF192 domain-containing protein [Candidatus Pacebacteria bacterium]|nr:DUF192 domain-containing protein [Candidatus Paceibacterota bacterium]